MNNWIENTGVKPDCELVDIKLNSGIRGDDNPKLEWYNQNPNRWDWQTWMATCRITHWRKSEPLK
jgi:hypothetical protein